MKIQNNNVYRVKEYEMDNKYMIRILKKVFNDGFKGYWFNVPKYVGKSANYTTTEIVNKLQTIEYEEVSETALRKRVERVKKYSEGLIADKSGKEESFSIKCIKELGLALCEDEFAFLLPIEPNTILQTAKLLRADVGDDDLRVIYDMLNAILYELECSSYYNFQPGTEEDGMAYYDMRFQEIRRAIDSRFWNKREIKNKLYQIVQEEEVLVRSCSVPGVAERWYEINPNIFFFDCVYDFIEESPETYERIRYQNLVEKLPNTIGFSFYPTEEEVKARNKYFSEIKDRCNKDNLSYSWDRLYQNELVNTLSMIFECEFSGVYGE